MVDMAARNKAHKEEAERLVKYVINMLAYNFFINFTTADLRVIFITMK